MTKTKIIRPVDDSAGAAKPADGLVAERAHVPALEPTTLLLFPNEQLVKERFEYGGHVARSLDDPFEVWPCDEAYLLSQGFTREDLSQKPKSSTELAEMIRVPTPEESAEAESAKTAPAQED